MKTYCKVNKACRGIELDPKYIIVPKQPEWNEFSHTSNRLVPKGSIKRAVELAIFGGYTDKNIEQDNKTQNDAKQKVLKM